MKYGQQQSYNVGDAIVYVNWLTSAYGDRMPMVMRISSINNNGTYDGTYIGTVPNGNQGGIDSMRIADMKPASRKQILDYAKAKAKHLAENWQFETVMGSNYKPTESIAQQQINELVKEIVKYEPTYVTPALVARVSEQELDKRTEDFMDFFKGITNTTESDPFIKQIRKLI